MARIWTLPWLVGMAAAGFSGSAGAQGNIDAGKSAAQIFSDTCSACHRRPQDLKRTTVGFMRSHYTTGQEEAAAMAGYLGSIASDPRAAQRRPGAAGTEAPKEASRSGQPKDQPKDLPKATTREPKGAGRPAAPSSSGAGARTELRAHPVLDEKPAELTAVPPLVPPAAAVAPFGASEPASEPPALAAPAPAVPKSVLEPFQE